MLKFGGSSCVYQVQGKAPRVRGVYGEFGGGLRPIRARGPAEDGLQYDCSATRWYRDASRLKPRFALAMVSGDRLTTPASEKGTRTKRAPASQYNDQRRRSFGMQVYSSGDARVVSQTQNTGNAQTPPPRRQRGRAAQQGG